MSTRGGGAGAASRWCVWPAVGSLTIGTTSWRLKFCCLLHLHVPRCLRHCNQSNGYTGSTGPASIRCTRSRPRRQESSATCAERRTSRRVSCAFRDRRDRLRSRVASCHQVGARRGGYSWAGLHELRWATATAQLDPAAGSRNAEGGSGQEYSGWSRRWCCPCGGIGGATACLFACRADGRPHPRFCRAQRAGS
jgi:hypothetical protein